MSDFYAGLIVVECVFFVFILISAHWAQPKRLDTSAENKELHSEVSRLNQKNVELTQEISTMRYR